MCGIVGYVGAQQAAPLLLEGLGRLEHRGYDSAGVAVLSSGKPARCGWRRRPGGCATWPTPCPSGSAARSAIGHTRWATHGPANDVNAHPHTDAKGDVAVVHNGIIDNAAALRAELTDAGVDLVSDTDTEVIAHLVARSEADTLEEKVSDALSPDRGHLRAGGAARRLPRPDRRRPQRQPADHRRR